LVITDEINNLDDSFYIHKYHDLLGQYPKPEDKINNFEIINMRSQDITSLIKIHGEPYYIKIDLETCTIQSDLIHTAIRFSIDPFWQECLIKGLDEIDLTLSYQSSIDTFETEHLANSPWLTHAHK